MFSNACAARYIALMPAAGTGSRVGAPLPKQYLPIGGESMIRHTARALLAAPWIERLLVVVAPGDTRGAIELAGLPRTTVLPAGGATRRDTVLAGLRALERGFETGDAGAGVDGAGETWVLVHDAARPAIDLAALERLRSALADDPVGGLLAVPLGDTLKRAAPSASGSAVGLSCRPATVAETLPRDGLWLAQTPQMFRFGLLFDALSRFAEVTDEASAIELAGLAPRLIAGSRTNFKVTSADDLESMRRLMRAGQGQ